MTAARLLGLFDSSFLRVSQIPAFKSNAVCVSSSIRLNCYATSAIAVDSAASALTELDASAVPGHPWPEWVDLVDRFRAKGYLTLKEDAVGASGVAGVYTDMKLIKDAALSFSRDRYDIFRSLCKEDIQNVVGKGCPNLLRKAVNSAKRLRAYLGIDEGEACGSCNLRGSCDRAYVVLEGSETTARTVDVVRILLLYALDPLCISEDNKLPGRESIELSAKKLLLQLIELDETPIDPNLPMPAPMPPPKKKPSLGEWQCSECKVINSSNDLECRSCGWEAPRENMGDGKLEKGDWMCPGCSFCNFARNVRCLKCGVQAPERIGAIEMKKGDWNCLHCSFMNFAANKQCFRCKDPRPPRQLRPGDWECPRCDFLNFCGNIVCKKCNVDRPESWKTEISSQSQQQRPGDWECPTCDFVNFQRNTVCKKCNLTRPETGKNPSESSYPQRPGDWNCPSCKFLNFSRNTACKKCNLDRPSGSGMQSESEDHHTWNQLSSGY